jgi:hypothetical protein
MSDTVIHAVILALYLVFMLGVGIYFYRKNQNQSDYFLVRPVTQPLGHLHERPSVGHERGGS